MTSEEKLFRFVSRIFAEFCQRKSLTVLCSAADKHGSWTWEAAAELDDLIRSIMFGLTPVDPWPTYRVSVTVQTENDAAFTRHVQENWEWPSYSRAASDIAAGHIEKALAEGWLVARQFTTADLTEKRLSPQHPIPVQ